MIPNINVTPDTFRGIYDDALPSKTYNIDFDAQRITGYIDEIEAVKQTIYLIMRTERYNYLVYSRMYGIELEELFGREKRFVFPQLMTRITDALLQDDRILNVSSFRFGDIGHGHYTVSFSVETIFGNQVNITDEVVI